MLAETWATSNVSPGLEAWHLLDCLGRDGSSEEIDRETGEEQITVGWTRRKDGG